MDYGRSHNRESEKRSDLGARRYVSSDYADAIAHLRVEAGLVKFVDIVCLRSVWPHFSSGFFTNYFGYGPMIPLNLHHVCSTWHPAPASQGNCVL